MEFTDLSLIMQETDEDKQRQVARSATWKSLPFSLKTTIAAYYVIAKCSNIALFSACLPLHRCGSITENADNYGILWVLQRLVSGNFLSTAAIFRVHGSGL